MTKHVVESEAGFSMIEMLVAMTIFAIGLLATAGMQITSLQANAGAYKRTTINAAAAGIMEEILTWAPDDPRLVDDSGAHDWDFDPTAAVNNTLIVDGGGSYTAAYTVQTNFPVNNVSTITLTINSSSGLATWGQGSRVLTCLKKTQGP